MADQVGREHVEPGEAGLGELREVAAVARDAVEADDAWIPGRAPLLEGERHPACSVSSDSGTISTRCSPGSFTSDQMTIPSFEMRNVPRNGAPVCSSKTPYALAAAPCGQKSDAKT